jgi:hypothetical protein
MFFVNKWRRGNCRQTNWISPRQEHYGFSIQRRMRIFVLLSLLILCLTHQSDSWAQGCFQGALSIRDKVARVQAFELCRNQGKWISYQYPNKEEQFYFRPFSRKGGSLMYNEEMNDIKDRWETCQLTTGTILVANKEDLKLHICNAHHCGVPFQLPIGYEVKYLRSSIEQSECWIKVTCVESNRKDCWPGVPIKQLWALRNQFSIKN